MLHPAAVLQGPAYIGGDREHFRGYLEKDRRKCRGYANEANTTFQHRCTIRNADTDRNASDVEQCG